MANRQHLNCQSSVSLARTLFTRIKLDNRTSKPMDGNNEHAIVFFSKWKKPALFLFLSHTLLYTLLQSELFRNVCLIQLWLMMFFASCKSKNNL